MSWPSYAEPTDLLHTLKANDQASRASQNLSSHDLPRSSAFFDQYFKLKDACLKDYASLTNSAYQSRRQSLFEPEPIASPKAVSSKKDQRLHLTQNPWQLDIMYLQVSASKIELTRFYRPSVPAQQVYQLPVWQTGTDFDYLLFKLSKLTRKSVQQQAVPQLFLGFEYYVLDLNHLSTEQDFESNIPLAHHQYESRCIIIEVLSEFLGSPLGKNIKLSTHGRSPSLLQHADHSLKAQSFYLHAENLKQRQSFLTLKLSTPQLQKDHSSR